VHDLYLVPGYFVDSSAPPPSIASPGRSHAIDTTQNLNVGKLATWMLQPALVVSMPSTTPSTSQAHGSLKSCAGTSPPSGPGRHVESETNGDVNLSKTNQVISRNQPSQ
jgi:hypothetical protein